MKLTHLIRQTVSIICIIPMAWQNCSFACQNDRTEDKNVLAAVSQTKEALAVLKVIDEIMAEIEFHIDIRTEEGTYQRLPENKKKPSIILQPIEGAAKFIWQGSILRETYPFFTFFISRKSIRCLGVKEASNVLRGLTNNCLLPVLFAI